VLLIMALFTSYYLQIKRIRAVHETVISIFAGMAVGLILRLSPGTLIQEMLVSLLVDNDSDNASVATSLSLVSCFLFAFAVAGDTTLTTRRRSSTPSSSTFSCRQLSSTRATSSNK
jgi:hypothetical protein